MYLGHSWIDSILKHSPEGSALHDINLNVREEGEAVSTFATKDEAVCKDTRVTLFGLKQLFSQRE